MPVKRAEPFIKVPMQSLGYQTEVFLARIFGQVVDLPSYVAIRTPSNPDFHWGNYVIFKQAPSLDSTQAWLEVFEQEIVSQQPTRHVLLAWDGITETCGDPSGLIERGLGVELSHVLTTEMPEAPDGFNTELEVRALVTEDDWAQALENQILCRGPAFSRASWEPFKTAQMRTFREAAEAGHGAWFGAFVGSTLVGDLGIYVEGTLGRYQNVGTHPDWRRQSVARSLVYKAGCIAKERWGLRRLVIVVEPDSEAERVYHAAGFRMTEWMSAAYRSPWTWDDVGSNSA